jgi:hypothetical protein
MPQMSKTDKQNAINAALDFVHTDEENLIKQVAGEHALINMGMCLEDHMNYYTPRPEHLLYDCFNSFYQQSESDEMADGTMDEYKSWVKQAKKDIKLVKKAKLALTARNVRAAFLCEGPFKKK